MTRIILSTLCVLLLLSAAASAQSGPVSYHYMTPDSGSGQNWWQLMVYSNTTGMPLFHIGVIGDGSRDGGFIEPGSTCIKPLVFDMASVTFFDESGFFSFIAHKDVVYSIVDLENKVASPQNKVSAGQEVMVDYPAGTYVAVIEQEGRVVNFQRFESRGMVGAGAPVYR